MARDTTLELWLLNRKQLSWVSWKTNGDNTRGNLTLGKDPVVLLDFSATDLRSTQHADDVNAGTSQRNSHGVLSHVNHVFDQRSLQDKLNTIVMRSNVPNRPQNGSLFTGCRLFIKELLLELPNIVLLLDVISTILGLYELSEKMHRCVDNLVLLW